MIAEPEIVETTARHAAVIHLAIPRREMMGAFGAAVREVMTALAAQGVTPSGPVFAHHLAMAPDMFDFELGVPVVSPIMATGRVRPGGLPALRVARTVYAGPYEGLPAAWAAFGAWISAQGYAPAEDLWEVYAAGPQSSSDSSTWRTELNRPIKAA